MCDNSRCANSVVLAKFLCFETKENARLFPQVNNRKKPFKTNGIFMESQKSLRNKYKSTKNLSKQQLISDEKEKGVSEGETVVIKRTQ